MTQDILMKQISEKEGIDIAIVRKIFQTAEEIIFDYLSSTTQSDKKVIKVLNGLSLECKYVPEKEIHTYGDFVCKSRIWVKPKITRYYNRKLNGYFDNS